MAYFLIASLKRGMYTLREDDTVLNVCEMHIECFNVYFVILIIDKAMQSWVVQLLVWWTKMMFQPCWTALVRKLLLHGDWDHHIQMRLGNWNIDWSTSWCATLPHLRYLQSCRFGMACRQFSSVGHVQQRRANYQTHYNTLSPHVWPYVV